MLALSLGLTGCAGIGGGPSTPQLAAGPLPTSRVTVYADMGMQPPPDIARYVRATGQQDLVLAFVLAGPRGCDEPTWGGTTPLSAPPVAARVEAVRASGGTVTVATGGAMAPYLETSCPDADSLTRAYQRALDSAGTNSLDVDLEAAVDSKRVADAIAHLQQQRHTAITLTLPAADRHAPLTAAGMELVRDLADRNVAFRTNVMAMNFPDSASWAEAMKGTVDSATAQLAQVWPTADPAELRRRLGVTVMAGRNDRGMITTLDDAEAVVAHARELELGSVGMWSLSRDSGTCPGAVAARPDCSGVEQDRYAYTAVLQSIAVA